MHVYVYIYTKVFNKLCLKSEQSRDLSIRKIGNQVVAKTYSNTETQTQTNYLITWIVQRKISTYVYIYKQRGNEKRLKIREKRRKRKDGAGGGGRDFYFSQTGFDVYTSKINRWATDAPLLPFLSTHSLSLSGFCLSLSLSLSIPWVFRWYY